MGVFLLPQMYIYPSQSTFKTRKGRNFLVVTLPLVKRVDAVFHGSETGVISVLYSTVQYNPNFRTSANGATNHRSLQYRQRAT